MVQIHKNCCKIYPCQIESAKGDRTTILPENLQRPEHWNVEVSP
ncbi:MAG: hypothetical protein PUP90_15195 [Nostoc sp. S4]|nr:hypothetical protein [Nostoc sp. S4]